MKVYQVSGKDIFDGVHAIVMSSSKEKAKQLVVSGTAGIEVEDLNAKVLKFGSDTTPCLLISYDMVTMDFALGDILKEENGE